MDIEKEVKYMSSGISKIAAIREGGFQDRAADLIRIKNLEIDELMQENAGLLGLKKSNEELKERIRRLERELLKGLEREKVLQQEVA